MLRDSIFMEAQTMCNSCNSGCFGGMIFPSFVQNSCCNPCCANSSSSGSVGGTSDSNTGCTCTCRCNQRRDGCRDVHGQQQQQRYFHHLRVQSLQFLRLQSLQFLRLQSLQFVRLQSLQFVRLLRLVLERLKISKDARPRRAAHFAGCVIRWREGGTDMISIDEQKERQVWSRVMNTAVSCPKPEEPKQDTGLTEKTLAQMIQCECCEAAIYRSLAAQGPRCARERLLRIAEDERCHAKQLGALYFLMTGKEYCPEPVRGACTACFNEALRKQYQAELEAEARYAKLAARAGEQACMFEALARDEGRHAKMIYCILQQTL